MAAPTCTVVGDNLLRLLGIVSRDTTSPTTQATKITAGDLADVATAMTQAIQVMQKHAPAEARQRPGSGYLNAPTTVSLTATIGSTTISALTTYAAWMLGCTIRIDGDSQDNELLTSTLLARPYTGTTGSGKAATVYGDCIQLDETTGEIMGPMLLQSFPPILPAFTREEFLRLGNYSLLTDGAGFAAVTGFPFYFVSQKPISTRPWVYFVDSLYTATLDYVPRKIRFSPMPNVALSIGCTAGINPIRIATTDIDGTAHADPGVKLPVIDGMIESIYLPICRQIMTGLPRFKNTEALAEIGRAYKEAMSLLLNSGGQRGLQQTIFH